jgi:hypothetical protein
MRRAALAAVGLALAAGCKRKVAVEPPRDAAPLEDAAVDADDGPWRAPMAVLDDVQIALTGAADGALESHELGRQLARCLIEHGDDVVALDRQADPTRLARHARLVLGIGAEPTASGDRIVVAFAAKLVWTDDDALPVPVANLVGDATIVGGHTATAVLAITDQLREESCRLLAARLDLLGAGDLGPGLAAADPETVAWALAVVAARRPPEVLDAVVALLDRPPPVGDAAITALVALHDPRAVTALTDRIDLADRDRLTTVIEATIAIGGPDAEDFLRVLTAHSDPEIAEHARQGLARLEARQSPSQ